MASRLPKKALTAFASSPKTVAYDELADDGEQIRLIKLKPAGLRGRIVGELHRFDIADAPRYAAISYTWGDPIDDYEIFVNGRKIAVRESCYWALWQARHQGLYEHVWIDAICINQHNIHEKGHQVGMMGDIFARADTVLVSLGPHADDSEDMIAVLRQFYETTNEITESRWNYWADHCGHEQLSRFHRALHAFSNKEYWRRVWVVQELCLARAIYVLCGTDIIDWIVLSRLRHFRWMLPKLVARSNEDKPKETRSKTDLHTIDIAPMWTIAEALKLRKLSFKYVVSTFSTWLCSHPLDRIYGFLHVIDWSEGSLSGMDKLRPDYSKSAYELMLECMDLLVWRNSDSATSAWITTRRLMTCLHWSDAQMSVRDLLMERQGALQDSSHNSISSQKSSLSLGVDLKRRPFVFGKFEFWGMSRIAKYDNHGAFTAAFVAGYEIYNEDSASSTSPEPVPLLFTSTGTDWEAAGQEHRAGYICPAARNGDLILQPADFSPLVAGHTPCLVVREVPCFGIHEIIGYAALSEHWRFCYDSSDIEHLNDLSRTLVVDQTQSFEGAFCKEDVVAYMALWNGGPSLYWSPDKHFHKILGTRFTASRYSSFVISQTHGSRKPEIGTHRRRASWHGSALLEPQDHSLRHNLDALHAYDLAVDSVPNKTSEDLLPILRQYRESFAAHPAHDEHPDASNNAQHEARLSVHPGQYRLFIANYS